MMISILVPLFPNHSFWQETLNSIERATKNNIDLSFEIIILKMGSTGSFIFPSNFKVIESQRLNVSAARNKLFDYATCDYVTFIDDDDIVTPHRFNRIQQYIEQGYDLIIDGVISFNEKGIVRDEQCYTRWAKNPLSIRPFNFFLWRMGFSRPIVKRKFLEENSIYHDDKISRMEDLHYRFDIISCAPKTAVVNSVGYKYRIRKNGLSNQNHKDELLGSSKILEKIQASELPLTKKAFLYIAIKFKFLKHIEYLAFPLYKLSEKILGYQSAVSVIHTYGLGDLVMAEKLIEELTKRHGVITLYVTQTPAFELSKGWQIDVKSTNYMMLLINMIRSRLFSGQLYRTYYYRTLINRLLEILLNNTTPKPENSTYKSECLNLREKKNMELVYGSAEKGLHFITHRDITQIDDIYFHFGDGDKYGKSLTHEEQTLILKTYTGLYPLAKLHLITGPRDDSSTHKDIKFEKTGSIDLRSNKKYNSALCVCNDTGIGHFMSSKGASVDVIVTERSQINVLRVLPNRLRSLVVLG